MGMMVMVIGGVHALENGLGLRPAMGYNTWNDYLCDVDANDIIESANALVAQGLDKVGYEYVNLDDCWAISRNEDGRIVADPQRFPNGIKAVADYVHSLGLKFGIYTDRGNWTCQRRPGSKNYEDIDAQTYASWGVDYLKEDSCYATQIHKEAFEEYGFMANALNSTSRPIYFSLCGWFPWYAPYGSTLGNSWRISDDCTDWSSVIKAIDTNAPLSQYAGPGGWNDPDMLIGSSNITAFTLTPIQSRTMFSMWSVMAAPLLIGSNIRNLSSWDLETYTNIEVIQVDQDTLGVQGNRLSGSDLHGKVFGTKGGTNIWGRPLQTGAWAVVFLNNYPYPTSITCDSSCFAQMTLPSLVSVRDLWAHTNNGTTTTVSYTVSNVPADGGSVMVRFDPL